VHQGGVAAVLVVGGGDDELPGAIECVLIDIAEDALKLVLGQRVRNGDVVRVDVRTGIIRARLCLRLIEVLPECSAWCRVVR
jgi:hypothetical protein